MHTQTEANLKRSLSGQEQQSDRKKQKHKFEDLVADALGGVTIPGHGKTDVVAEGINYSVKNANKAIQFLMRRVAPTIQEWGPTHPISVYTKATSDCWAKKWTENTKIEADSVEWKNVQESASNLVDWLSDKANLEKVLRWAMTANGEIEKFADGCLETDKVYVYNAEDVIKTLMECEFNVYTPVRKNQPLKSKRAISINVITPSGKKYKLMSIEPRTDKNNYGATNYRTDSKNFVNHMRSTIDNVKVVML